MKGLARVVVLAALAACGCTSVKIAREAQRCVAPDACAAGNRAPKDRWSFAGFKLPDFVEFALTNRPETLSAALAVKDAELAVGLVRSDGPLVPQVNGNVGYSRATSNGRHFSGHTRGDPSGSLSVDLLVYDFGRHEATERAAVESLLAAECALAEERLTIFGEVAAAYFGLMRSDALFEVARTNEFQFAQHLEQTERLVEAGEKRRLDLLRARLDLSEAQSETIAASNAVAVAASSFLRALGLEVDRATRDDVLGAAPNGLAVALQEIETSNCDAVAALVAARDASPALATKRALLRAASADVDEAIADLFPELSLDTAIGFTDRIWNWSWGVKLVQSVFAGHRKTLAVDRATVALLAAREDVATAELELSHQLASAVTVRDNAREQLACAKVRVVQTRENYDVVQEEYKMGEASRVDFTDAAAGLSSALGDRVKAFYAGQIAEAELVRLTGASPVYLEKKCPMDESPAKPAPGK